MTTPVTPAPFTIVFPVFDRLPPPDFTGPYQVLVRLPSARLAVASSGRKAAATFEAARPDLAHPDVVSQVHGCCVAWLAPHRAVAPEIPATGKAG